MNLIEKKEKVTKMPKKCPDCGKWMYKTWDGLEGCFFCDNKYEQEKENG